MATEIDITRDKEMEEAMIQSQKLDAVGKLAGGLSHDYNNLLTIILGQAEMILGSLEDDHENRERAEEILKAVKRSSHITRTLLTFSKQEYRNPKVIFLDEAIEEILPLIKIVVKDRVQLVIDVDETISKNNPVLVDTRQLEQVILNLCINAYESMQHGGTITISLGEDCDMMSNCCSIRITDTGIGVDEDILTKIFDPFFTTKETGAGLGLFTSKEIIESNNGQIVIDTTSGQGSTFIVCLPKTKKLETETLEIKKAQRGELEPLNILLVDDEETILKIISRSLITDGHKVLTANDGIEAKKIIENRLEKFDLLITDIVMPRMSGIELINSAKENLIETKIIFISGFSKEILIAEEPSSIPFLIKPFSYATLTETIYELMY